MLIPTASYVGRSNGWRLFLPGMGWSVWSVFQHSQQHSYLLSEVFCWSSGQPHSSHPPLRPEQSSVWAWAVCEVKMNIIWIPLLSTLFHRLVITNKYKLKIKEEANVRSVKYKKNKTDNLSTLVHPQRKSFIMKHLSVSALRLKLWRLPLFNTFYRSFDCHQHYHVRLLSSLRNPSEMLCFT